MRIVCDFDGTISRVDSTDHVLTALAKPNWRRIEAAWVAGKITAAQCMRRQIALIDASQEALDAVLDGIELDPAFVRFARWCEAEAIELSIVSDGVDYFIRRILQSHGLERLTFVANELVGPPSRRRLAQPWAREGCAAGSGVCKCSVAVVESFADDPLVYVGDGRSDFCVSARADVLFAKHDLAVYAAARGRPFYPFTTFDDVAAVVARLRQTGADAPALAAV